MTNDETNDSSEDPVEDSMDPVGDNLESTVESFGDKTIELGNSSGAPSVWAGNAASHNLEPNQQTLDPFGMDQSSSNDDTQLLDGSALGDTDATIQLGNLPLRPSPPASRESSAIAGSIMESEEIDMTINPRELSAKDAAFWGSAAVGASRANQGEVSEVGPAIERSIHETNLQLRQRDLAPPTRDPELPSDYRLVRLLGRGGMGNVYTAKQTSLDRVIAVKVIKPLPKEKREKLAESGRLEKVQTDRRRQFLSEAVVTGDLDHPNIVPIHDVAVASDNTLFYAMKRVVGRPWSDLINEKSRDENLEILLKVGDALAFAHTRGVVHRDIKPENIMLGDFGEVLVMDWGLALAQPGFEKSESIAHTAGLGGTPAFMAPEMARGPISAIGPASDIYLLGATLYFIITGKAPHYGENVSQCIKAVSENQIRETPPEFQGELMNVALKAMATNSDDRYESVVDFQNAIREYRSHAESISLASIAHDHLQSADQQRGYDGYSRATIGFEQALGLWEGNHRASEGLATARLAHAKAAYAGGDYELGLSVLDEDNHDHQPLIRQLRAGIAQRESRQSRLALFKRLAIAALGVILIGGAAALYLINDQKQKAVTAQGLAEKNHERAEGLLVVAKENLEKANAEEQKAIAAKMDADVARQLAEKREDDAVKARDEAKRQEMYANEQADIAKEARKVAEDERMEAERQKMLAEDSARQAREEKAKTEYEVYLSQIGLAKARIERNEFESARKILSDLRRDHPLRSQAWEWRWLSAQANQSESAETLPAAMIDALANHSGNTAFAIDADAKLHRVGLTASGKIDAATRRFVKLSAKGSCIAISPNGQRVAVGSTGGDVMIFDAGDLSTLQNISGHQNSVTDAIFADDQTLLTSSSDRTVSIWNIDSGQRIQQCWHIAPVVQIDATLSLSKPIFVAAVSDSASGRAVVWQLDLGQSGSKAIEIGEFARHDRPLSSVAISADGKVAASADLAGNLYTWNPRSLKTTDYESAIQGAITRMTPKNPQSAPPALKKADAKFTKLIDRNLLEKEASTNVRKNVPAGDMMLVSTSQPRAHADVIRRLRFANDGKTLASGSDDYTVKLWRAGALQKTIRGHGGWVTAVDFIGDSPSKIFSASADQSIRSWNTKSYREAFVEANRRAIDKTSGKSGSTGKLGSTGVRAHEDEILDASFDVTGTRIVSASRDHTARILSLDREKLQFNEVAIINPSSDEELSEGTEYLAMTAVMDKVHKRLFIGSADSVIRIWDLENGTQQHEITGTGLNSAIALSGDGMTLLTLSSSPDAKAILWNVDPMSGVPTRRFKINGHDQAITALAVSPDGRHFFTGDRSGRGLLWDSETGTQIGKPIDLVRGFRINDAEFTPSGDVIWIASDDQQLTSFDLRLRQRLQRLNHDGFVTGVSLSQDGRHAVTISEIAAKSKVETKVLVWNLLEESKREIASVSSVSENAQQHARISSAEFGQSDRWIALTRKGKSGRSGQVALVPRDSRQSPDWLQMPATIGPAQHALALPGPTMITLNGDGGFRWNWTIQKHEKSYRAHAAVVQARFSPNGQLVATASRSLKLWNSSTGQPIDKLENPHKGPVRSFAFAPIMNRIVVVTGGDDSMVRLWHWNANAGFRAGHSFELPDKSIRILEFSSDSRWIFAGTDTGAWLLSTSDKDRRVRLNTPEGSAVISASFSRDGRWLLAGSSDKQARLWDLKNNSPEPAKIFTGHADQIESVAIIEDASGQLRIVTASRDKSARLWDPRIELDEIEGREILTLRKHTLGVTAVDVTKDGELLMTAGRDGSVILWPAPMSE